MRNVVWAIVRQTAKYKFWVRLDSEWDGVKFVCRRESNTGDSVLMTLLGTEWDFFFEIYRFKAGMSKKSLK
jgi:hypothetical protein